MWHIASSATLVLTHLRRHHSRLVAALVLLLYIVPSTTLSASAQSFDVVANLWGEFQGVQSWGGVIRGSDGAVYGVTMGGGSAGELGRGVIYRVASDGTVTVLRDFNGTPIELGHTPFGELVEGPDGNLYGLALGGSVDPVATCGIGIIFKITPSGTYTVVHALAGFDQLTNTYPEGIIGSGNGCGVFGAERHTVLALGRDGHFYGIAQSGGNGNGGAIFRLTLDGEFSVIHHMGDVMGPLGIPYAAPVGLTVGSDGNLYGVSSNSGQFRLTPDGVFTGLWDPTDTEPGLAVIAPWVEGNDGQFYAIAFPSNPANVSDVCGVLYRISPDGVYTRIAAMPVEILPDGTVGSCPAGHAGGTSLTKGTDGDFYGVARFGGEFGGGPYGAVFKITPTGDVTTLHSFFVDPVQNGYYPTGRLLEGMPGVFYGTTSGFGGSVVFKLTLESKDHAPVALDGAITLYPGASYTGVLAATDVDSTALTYTLASNGTKGTAVVTDATTGAFTYTAFADRGTDSFTFIVTDDTGLTSNVATIAVTIQPCASNVTGSLSISQGQLRLNRKTRHYTQKVTLKNISSTAIAGPVSLVFDSLTRGTTVVGATGVTACAAPVGSPLVTVNVGADGIFSNRERANASLEFTIEFVNAASSITYVPRVLAGTGDR